jgi:undecaprenyl-diphosphatase
MGLVSGGWLMFERMESVTTVSATACSPQDHVYTALICFMLLAAGTGKGRFLSVKAKQLVELVYAWIEGIRSSPAVERFVQRHPGMTGFIGRRFSPDVYLGLHLTVGLFASILFIWIFGSITEEVLEYDTLVTVDHWITEHVSSIRSPPADRAMIVVTQFGGRSVLPLGTMVTAGLFLAMRRYILAAGFFIANAGGYLLVVILKMTIQRERPFAEYTHLEVAGFSYPSGHAMMAVIFYGMLAYFLTRTVQSRRLRIFIVCIAALVITMIGFSRIYLGVHYISDVAAGFAGGLFWLSVCITGLEIYRTKIKIS